MYHLSLYFDEKTTKQLQTYQIHLSQSLKPTVHLTLIRFDSHHLDWIIQELDNLLKEYRIFELYFVSLGSLQAKHLFIQPVYHASLHDLMKKIDLIIKCDPSVHLSSYYQFLNWLPHVTIARNQNRQQITQNFSLLNQQFKPFKGKVTQIRLTHLQPYQEIKVWNLR
ncbi:MULTISPECIES: 2'-5' RNA ligase family protein [Coprobacillaceae]|uniref:2'-5' RNA ligase family protein n=1 Tax=Coprobacillaceae TaxID=2810280 RepID=UPI000E4F2E1A|nr:MULTISPECIES: 2'-5' RNA ligase family protein [Coprobacillaceae]RHM60884.1 hypothetical protein DWZ53_06170 [Coprobacillus sp. AF33-1AC]RHS94501.1 hypothetical protein DW911_05045 [Erysipelatoclostridium sp. AM42-17]